MEYAGNPADPVADRPSMPDARATHESRVAARPSRIPPRDGAHCGPKNLTAQILRAADGGPTIPKTPPERMLRTHVHVCLNDMQACPECQAAYLAVLA